MADQGIIRNVAAGKAAKDLLAKVPDVLDEDVDEAKFWEVLAIKAAAMCGLTVMAAGEKAEAMTYEEALAFEAEIVPGRFTAHAGERMGDVPMSYWIGLTESEWGRKLSRYKRSRRCIERQL